MKILSLHLRSVLISLRAVGEGEKKSLSGVFICYKLAVIVYSSSVCTVYSFLVINPWCSDASWKRQCYSISYLYIMSKLLH